MRSLQLRRRLANVVNRTGRRYEDPICGHSFRYFMPGPRHRPQTYCPACGSAERHRVLYLFLRTRTDVFHHQLRVLHVAPEGGIGRRLRELRTIRYVSTDIEPGAAMLAADLTQLPFEDESFDVVICNHVLEHIPDDIAAMREIRRVLARGRYAVMQHPIDADRPRTWEDWSVKTPDDRERAFFQSDHVRIYGRDFADRLAEAGFTHVTATKYQAELPPADVERYGLSQRPSNMPERDIEADVIYMAGR